MKEAWSEENDKIEYTNSAPSSASKLHRPGLLTGLTPPPGREIILASIPSREDSDNLLIQFFDSYNPAIPARCKSYHFVILFQADSWPRCPPQSNISQAGKAETLVGIVEY